MKFVAPLSSVFRYYTSAHVEFRKEENPFGRNEQRNIQNILESCGCSLEEETNYSEGIQQIKGTIKSSTIQLRSLRSIQLKSHQSEKCIKFRVTRVASDLSR